MKQRIKVRIGEDKFEGGTERVSSIAYTLQHLFGRFKEELFPEHRGCKNRRKKNQVHNIAVNMALLAADERILKNMLMEINDRCEDYGMKINIRNTKVIVTGRKQKKPDMRFKDESVKQQVNNFKYLGCNFSNNMNCCQEVKQRIAMAKEASNWKRLIFCGPLEK